jgi:PAC2 family
MEIGKGEPMAALDPEELYELDSDLPDLRGAVLITVLDGFVDAGSAVVTARDQLLANPSGRVIARFDIDQLFDYRARRPMMHFEQDHWASFDAPTLDLYALTDDDGTPFLVLSGPEPDVQWERFVVAVRRLIDRFEVRLTVGLNAFPMGVPHTRPTRVILHGSRPELYSGYEPWLGEILVPASAGHLLELRLGEAGYDALGVAVPVPAYLAQTVYPSASAAMLREVGARTGLQLSLAELDDAAAKARLEIDAQLAQSDEANSVVRGLEEQYDAYARGQGRSLLAEGGDLPTADELGAELERFLADRTRGNDKG